MNSRDGRSLGSSCASGLLPWCWCWWVWQHSRSADHMANLQYDTPKTGEGSMRRVPQGATLVIGLGVSGRAICRHLQRLGRSFVVADTRLSPPGVEDFRAAYPEVPLYCGPLSALDMDEAEEVVVSPGVDLRQPGLAEMRERRRANGDPLLVGEMALFVRAARAPIAAITGSNAKSTVTTLLGEMAREAGWRVAVGGNLGTPALDMLAEMPNAELYIIELSIGRKS